MRFCFLKHLGGKKQQQQIYKTRFGWLQLSPRQNARSARPEAPSSLSASSTPAGSPRVCSSRAEESRQLVAASPGRSRANRAAEPPTSSTAVFPDVHPLLFPSKRGFCARSFCVARESRPEKVARWRQQPLQHLPEVTAAARTARSSLLFSGNDHCWQPSCASHPSVQTSQREGVKKVYLSPGEESLLIAGAHPFCP